MKRGLLISGGGSWGAYGAGTLARLDKDYDTIVGVSTGALMSPFVALREWELLHTAYTTISNNDLFDKYWYKQFPISKSGKIRRLPIIISLILGQKSVSESHSLRKTIDKYFSIEMYSEIRNQGKEILVGTQNYAEIPSKIHYFSSSNENYEDFKDWLWCSANFSFFTSLVKKAWKDTKGNFHIGEWSDGGLTDLVGIDKLIGMGFTNVDIIIHRPISNITYEGNVINNLLDNVVTGISAMRHDIEFEFLYDRVQELNKEGTLVNIYWLPNIPEIDSMCFNGGLMTKWWDDGYNTALDLNRIEIFKPIKHK
jgi:NTE family protein